ncbi:hypothetical protein RMATCC62417_03956 [Rhizopus microsporus]|nr:hypothetical protein RMATCC62417_03956 [Rhizopus microsporus]
MERLPFEVNENILSRLDKKDLCSFALVNSYWRFISYQVLYKYPKVLTKEQLYKFSTITAYAQSFVRVLNLTPVHQYITDRLFQESLQHLDHLRQIHLDQCTHLSPFVIHSLVQKNLMTMDSLSLADCKLSKDILALIGKACQYRLTSLDLSNTMIQPCLSIDSSHHLEDMLRLSSSRLLHLDLSYCTWVDSLTVKNIARGLPKLQRIILQWCSQIREDAILDMVQQLINLTTIDVRNIETFGTTEQIEHLMSKGSSLKKVMFTYKRSCVVRCPSYE